MEKTGSSASIDDLRRQINILKERKRSIDGSKRHVPFSGVIISIVMLIVYYYTRSSIPLIIGIFYFTIAIIYPFLRITAPIDTEIEALEGELSFELTGVDAKEERAERFFKAHDIGLRKYYDQALNQTKVIFVVGIVCIIIGFGFIGTSFYLLYVKNNIFRNIEEKILIATLGTISGILTNFVALIYLRIFVETTKSFTSFHQKLVSSNHLYFVNLMLSKIEDKETLNATIKEISQKITEKI
jgi:hypothetical protein